MHPLLAAAASKALSTTSTMRWLVVTLPPTTAASPSGSSSEPGGITTVTGSRQPSLSGIASPIMQRRLYTIMESVTALGALWFPSTCGPVPVKSNTASPRSPSTVTLRWIGDPSSMASRASATRDPKRRRSRRTAAAQLCWMYSMYACTTRSERSRTMPSTSATPRLLAAIWALRSDTLSRRLRVPEESGEVGVVRMREMPSSWNTPSETSLNATMAAPSCASEVELGGIEPGAMPPMSAWCPREATQNTTRPSWNAGETTVMSGRCEPPAFCGWLDTNTSPSRTSPRQYSIWNRTAALIAPRCTGMYGACATSPPVGEKRAHEKSRRSLMFTDTAVRRSTRPICSATDMNRCEYRESWTGSSGGGSVGVRVVVAVVLVLVVGGTAISTSPSASTEAVHPGSTTTVEPRCRRMAGPRTVKPEAQSTVEKTGVVTYPTPSK